LSIKIVRLRSAVRFHWRRTHPERRTLMSIVKSILSRRAFTALQGAAVIATALPATSFAAEVTIPIIVKDTTSFYWQIVLAGARKAGKDLRVHIPALGAPGETAVHGQH